MSTCDICLARSEHIFPNVDHGFVMCRDCRDSSEGAKIAILLARLHPQPKKDTTIRGLLPEQIDLFGDKSKT